MKCLLITLIIVISYSVFINDYHIGQCDSIDTDLLQQYGFIERDGKYIGTYAKYDKDNNYCGEGTVTLDPSPCWVTL